MKGGGLQIQIELEVGKGGGGEMRGGSRGYI